MPAAAVVGGVLSVGSAVIGANASKKAAKVQAEAGRYAADLQNQQYQQTREDLAPWRLAGGQAIGQLSSMLQPGYDHTTSPGYQFRLSEGLRGVENSAAARGLLQSGGTLKGINNYAQGVAASDFGDQFNRVASVAAGGQQVNSELGRLGAQSAANQGGFLTQAANARASGYVGSANAIQGGLSSLSSIIGGFGGGF
jgi:hypothetical protein